MSMMKPGRCLAAFVVSVSFWGGAHAQDTGQALRLYETVPDVALEMVGYHRDSVRISDFRGKLLILDFWSRWCGSCIEKFPAFAALQQRFEEQMFILPVGYQSMGWDNIGRFYAEREAQGNPLPLPSAVQDQRTSNRLRPLFPFGSIPVLIWIDQNGRYIAATTSDFLHEATISRFLEKGKD